MNYFRHSLIVLCLDLGLAGCLYADHQAYDGPPRPPEEVARVYCECYPNFPWWSVHTCFISQVDGVSTYGEHLGINDIPSPPINQVNVLPGIHPLTFHYDVWSGYYFPTLITRESKILEFEAQAGHNYWINFEKEKGKLYSWIEDEETETIAAGEPP